MVEYVKHYFVDMDDPSIVLDTIPNGVHGKIHPQIPGLDVQIMRTNEYGADYFFSTVPDGTDITPFPSVSSITLQQYTDEWITQFNISKSDLIKAVYLEYKRKYDDIVDFYYNPNELLYGAAVKRTEAFAVQDSMTEQEAMSVAPTLSIEALIRGISVKVLAQKVRNHALSFEDTQAKLVGERGKIVDELSAFMCDTTNVDTIKKSIEDIRSLYNQLMNIPVGVP